jgi:hypothetical protein
MKYEEGRYCCEVTGQGFGETKVAKLPQIYVSFSPLLQIMPGGEREPVADAERRSYSRLLTNRDGEVTENMQKYLKLDLESIGFVGELEDFAPGSEGFCDCTGNEFIARCVFTERDGTQYEDWSIEWPRRGGGGGGSALDEASISSLSALYSSSLKETKAKTKTEKATSERF